MKIISIANQKGGCGKTTTAINLAACLGRRGKRVLLIDMDPQGHSSLGLGISSVELPGLYEVFSREATLGEVILPDVTSGVDLIPSTISLAAVEHLRVDIPQREQQLAIHLSQYGDRHDYVLIDCPPALGILSFNALRAADQVLIPIEMSLFAMDGIERLRDTIALLHKKYGLEIPIRVLPTLVDKRTRLCRSFLRQIWERFADEVFPVMIHQTVRLKEAACAGKPIIDFDPSCNAAESYNRVAEEIINDIDYSSQDIYQENSQTEIYSESRQESEALLQHSNILHDKDDSGLDDETEEQLQQIVLTLPGYANKNVKVAGDFNGWVPDEGVETRIIGDTMEKILKIASGFYQYRLIVDGSWQHDPSNPLRIPNQVGGHNSLLRVHEHQEQISA